MRYHCRPRKMITLKNPILMLEFREEGTPVHCLWEQKLVSPLWKTVVPKIEDRTIV